MAALLAAVALLLSQVPGAPRVLYADSEPLPFTRIRTSHSALLAALRDGEMRSPTLRGLIERAERFDAVLHITATPRMSGGIEACLLHWVGGSHTRHLRIHVSSRLRGDKLTVVLGHELQHALEALEDPEVIDGDSMRALFDRIGVRASRARDARTPFETQAAQNVSERIRRELAATLAAR